MRKMLLILAAVLLTSTATSAQTVPPGIQVAFKLDPRITGGLYMGTRWVSPPVFRTARVGGKRINVQALAQIAGATGGDLRVIADWTPEEPRLVRISDQGTEVTLTVRCGPPSVLHVEADEGTRDVLVTPLCSGGLIQAEFSQ